jgi:hypothetical protein
MPKTFNETMKTKLRSVFIGLALLVGVHPALAQPAFLCGAVLGVLGRDVVVKLSAAWGGLGKHKSLVEATLDWLKCPSPKLVPPEDRLAMGGGMI